MNIASLDSLSANADGHSIQLLSKPHEIGFGYITQHPFMPLYSFGIVNPHGPTMQAILAVRDGTKAPLALVAALLHPFVPSYQIIGYIRPAVSGQRTLEGDIINALDYASLHFRGCATLILRSPVLRLDQTMSVAWDMFLKQESLASKLQLVKAYWCDPWQRVDVEIGGPNKLLDTVGTASIPKSREEQAAELVSLMLNEKHLIEEYKAFAYAWRGSIEFLENNRANVPVKLSYDQVSPVLESLFIGDRVSRDSDCSPVLHG